METELSQFLSQKSVLGADSVEILLEFWKKGKRLKSKELLLNFNQQDSNLYFVKEGCVRLFVIDKNGEQINLGFGYENSLITCFQAFIEGKPSLMSIEAILDTELIAIAKADLMRLIHANSEIALWYQSMLEYTLTGHIQRQVELLTLKPHERYSVFIKRSGHLINRIPLKYIASYLMMKPETLSRIRAKIS
ncbi:Crp/Fnr family transcriptional regulator [Flavobacterium marginilacus]|uniref:Crp/Fnr family transcriptional regulator n=1 Tax=Flavobacterium marginilacus TaxID=3003256 RepID=UPI00248F3ACA|nr:Crp/Fnr family transcriptional regulator [Flavobacterium marginilacus]